MITLPHPLPIKQIVIVFLLFQDAEQVITVPLATRSACIWLMCGRVLGGEFREKRNSVVPTVSDGELDTSLATLRVSNAP